MYEQDLQNLGLSEKETKVYLASLEMGPETVQNIAKQSGINRATTYVQIGTLKAKGLMSEFEKGKKTYFVAENPGRLKNLMRVFEKELELKRSGIDNILPKLVDMFEGMGERPRVRFFEGFEGVSAIRQEYLKGKSKVSESFINYDKIELLFQGRQDSHSEQRANKKIKSLVLYTRAAGPLKGYSDPKKFRTAKHVKTKKYDFAADVTTYDNNTILVSYRTNPIGVIIESKEITDTIRAMFYLIWDNIA
jgi:HTH-type transcriptional regulator, sugar sensing transcriptional regulator